MNRFLARGVFKSTTLETAMRRKITKNMKYELYCSEVMQSEYSDFQLSF